MRRATFTALAAAALALPACGGGGGGGGEPTPVTTPEPLGTETVQVILYYDENGNRSLDGNEHLRVPDVEVQLSGRTARSARLTGLAVLDHVRAGAGTLSLRADTLPPYYTYPGAMEVAVPGPGIVYVPVSLPIGVNNAAVYLATGDSIAEGTGSSNRTGYRALLAGMLQDHFGGAEVFYRGVGGGISTDGFFQLDANLRRFRPGYTIVQWGTNDWHAPSCTPPASCFTVNALRGIVQQVKASQSLPVVASILPVLAGASETTPADRNLWIEEMNRLIRTMANEENVLYADLYTAFRTAGGAEPSRLYSDAVHPNDPGYAVIAQAYFEAIAHGRIGAAAFGSPAALSPPAVRGFLAPPAPRPLDDLQERASRP